MNLYLILIIVVSLFGIEIFIKKFNHDYLSKESCSAIKGFFVLIVFYSHLYKYIEIVNEKDFLILGLRDYLGQLMVVLFLFYSGYGVFESIKKKNSEYVKSIPQNRILKTLFHFDVAVLIFLILNIILNIEFPLKKILFSFVGWHGIGNSNWYIFGMLVMYLITYISFSIFDKKSERKKGLILIWILVLIFTYFVKLHREFYWYNTLLVYPFGLTYSFYKEKINQYLMSSNKKYILAFITCLLSFITLKNYSINGYLYYEVASMLFALMVVMITMKINFKSKILKWFGDNLFWFYILQRLPMIVLKYLGFTTNRYLFAFIAFVVTVILTYSFGLLFKKIDPIIFQREKSK